MITMFELYISLEAKRVPCFNYAVENWALRGGSSTAGSIASPLGWETSQSQVSFSIFLYSLPVPIYNPDRKKAT